MKTDDFVLELRQPKIEPLGGGSGTGGLHNRVWCLCGHVQCMYVYVYVTGVWCLWDVCTCAYMSPLGTSPYHLPNGLSYLVIG